MAFTRAFRVYDRYGICRYDGDAGKAARIGKQGIVRDIPGDILYPHGGIVVESESVPIFIDAFVDDGVD